VDLKINTLVDTLKIPPAEENEQDLSANQLQKCWEVLGFHKLEFQIHFSSSRSGCALSQEVLDPNHQDDPLNASEIANSFFSAILEKIHLTFKGHSTFFTTIGAFFHWY
jgi:hypothetical protein